MITPTIASLAGLSLLLAAPSWAGGITLDIDGTCPGTMDITVLVPAGNEVALVTASDLGNTTIPKGNCQGVDLGLGSGVKLRGTWTSDGTGRVDLSPNLPAGACGLWLAAVDLDACRVSTPVELVSTPVTVEFPSSDSLVEDPYYSYYLGYGGGGQYYIADTRLSETFTGTGRTEITQLDAAFDMDDRTVNNCPVGILTFNVAVNDVPLGAYAYQGGYQMNRISFNESWAFPPIAGTGPNGDDYTITFTSNETVCPGGGSYNWFPGGVTSLR